MGLHPLQASAGELLRGNHQDRTAALRVLVAKESPGCRQGRMVPAGRLMVSSYRALPVPRGWTIAAMRVVRPNILVYLSDDHGQRASALRQPRTADADLGTPCAHRRTYGEHVHALPGALAGQTPRGPGAWTPPTADGCSERPDLATGVLCGPSSRLADRLSDCAILRSVGDSGVAHSGCCQSEEVTILRNQHPTVTSSPLQVLLV